MDSSSTGTPSRRRSRLFLAPGPSPLASSSSQVGSLAYTRRGSSLRPEDARMSPSISSPSFTFGYGNETRIARSSFGLPPSNSPFQLASKSPLAQRLARSSLGPAAGSDSPQRHRGGSLGPMSIASGSVSGLSPNGRAGTPRTRAWKTLNLASPRSPRPGDELMRDFIASRTLTPSASKSRGMPVFGDYAGRSSRANSVQADTGVGSPAPPSLNKKREFDMSVDGDDTQASRPSARKRQMVWHPQLGFVSQEELQAREPKLPTPKNEAERLLNVLESMRKPTPSSAAFAGSRSLASVHVPIPVVDRASSKPALQKGKEANGRSLAATLAPYSRALRKSRQDQSLQSAQAERLSLRAKLRMSRASLQASRAEEEQAMEQSESETEEEEEIVPSPPRRQVKQPVRRSRRLRGRAAEEEEEEDHDMEQEEEVTAPAASKATAEPKVAEPKQMEEAKAVEVAKPTSSRISLAAAKPPAGVKKDNFSVRAQCDSSAPRERSSLRQGAAKTHRTHEKGTGRISAWEEDLEEDQDDLPDAQELAKIKLPTNMFPSGFSFGGAPAGEPAAAPKPVAATPSFSFGKPSEKNQAESKEDESAATKPAASSNPLLGRLGGFTAPVESTTPQKAPPAKSSFFEPSLPKSSAQPAPSVKPAEPAASSFFSTPVEPVKSTQDEKKSGPVPNFFGSAATKEADKPKPVDTTAAFNFGAPAAKPPAASFTGFGQATEKKEEEDKKAEQTPTAPTSKSFGGFTAPAKPEGSQAAAPSFSFGAPSTTPAATPAKPAFSFGGGGEKRSAEDDVEKKADEQPAAKKAAPSFSFGTPASKEAAAPAPTLGGFGKPAEEKKDESTSSKVPNFFGSSAAKTDTPPAAPSTPSFSFGKAAQDKPAAPFTFGAAASAPKPAPSFSFGAPSTPAPGPGAQSNGDMMEDSPSAAPSSAAAPAPFTFGSSGATTPTFGAGSATQSPKPTPPSFSFGAPSASTSTSFSAPSANGSTGFGAQPAPTFGQPQTQQSTFSFGAPAPASGFGSGSNTPFGGAPSTTFGAAATSTAAPSFGAPAASTPFTFGSPAPSATQFNGGSTAPTGFAFPPQQPSSPFAFNASNPTNPNPNPAPEAAATPPGSSAGLFSIGAASPAPPGQRAIKPLRRRR